MRDALDLRQEMRRLLEPVINAQTAANEVIAGLSQSVAVITEQGNYSEIQNVLDNSHPEYSKDAYAHSGVLPLDAGDDNLECHNWYRLGEAATELLTDSASALKSEKSSEPANHSLWAANEAITTNLPRWDKVNGTIEVGGTTRYDIYAPMPNDIIFPGQIFYIQFEAMLRTSTAMPTGLQAYCGFWDNTVGQRKWIEGGTFTITDDQGNDPGVTFGIPGATSVSYKVIAFTDSGEQAESNVLNFPNAPATFTGNNHPRVKFSGVPGFIKFDIYRLKGGVYAKQFTVGNTIDGTYYDVGNDPIGPPLSGWPSVTLARPRAYAITKTFAPGSLGGLGWVRQSMTVFVPTTYDKSVTTAGNQFFRFGFSAVTTDVRQILVRRFGLSMGSGKWARSANDTRAGAHSTPSSTATGAGSSGSGGVDPPAPGGGGGCVLIDSTIDMLTPFGSPVRKIIGDVGRGELTDSAGTVCGKVLYIKEVYAGKIYRVKTESGLSVGATFDHPFITSVLDFNGTPAEALKRAWDAGEDVYVRTRPKDKVISDRIISMDIEYGDFYVAIPTLEGSNICILNGFLSHNVKPIP